MQESFGWATSKMRAGFHVRRPAWAPWQWISIQNGPAIYIAEEGEENVLSLWKPTQDDLLASDWEALAQDAGPAVEYKLLPEPTQGRTVPRYPEASTGGAGVLSNQGPNPAMKPITRK